MDHLAHSVPIPGYEGHYRVCPCGLVLTLKRDPARPLVSFPRDAGGHHGVNLCLNGRMVTANLSGLVARAFLPPPAPERACVLHGDDNPANNAVDNLRWGTNAENSADMVRRNRQARGERNANARLTATQVAEIRRLAGAVPQNELARTYRISTSSLNAVVLRKTWRHV